jgi:magnesium-transporting ATPase (P-type)
MKSRRIELVCGLLGGILGLAALAVGLFAPLGTECTDIADPNGPGTCVQVSAVQIQGLASLWFAITVLGGLSLGIILFAVWHSLAHNHPALMLLWMCTVLLCVSAVLTLSLLGVFFVPAAVLAITASAVGTKVAQQRVPAPM